MNHQLCLSRTPATPTPLDFSTFQQKVEKLCFTVCHSCTGGDILWQSLRVDVGTTLQANGKKVSPSADAGKDKMYLTAGRIDRRKGIKESPRETSIERWKGYSKFEKKAYAALEEKQLFDYCWEDDLHPPYSPVSESSSDGLNFPGFSVMMDYLSTMCRKENKDNCTYNNCKPIEAGEKQKMNSNDERGFNLEYAMDR
ncbi:hypothetical protein DUI87_21682 [Hirundo rustica rustica]|uniref:Uncharacterized protein n=1 Tax=Hirundo rustica rustica TaxID=333673 RepID=A0A3M0JLF2_HIRRU|nr:hypothetical protein DUI87_21682 [Hirundo rustica rustica]